MSTPDPILIIAHARPDRPGKYAVEVAGEFIVRLTREPFLAGCRALIERGYDPTARAVLRHAGSTTDSLTGPIGEAAKLTVREPTRGNRPTFALWHPFPGAEADEAEPDRD